MAGEKGTREGIGLSDIYMKVPKETWSSRWQKNNLIEKPLENI